MSVAGSGLRARLAAILPARLAGPAVFALVLRFAWAALSYAGVVLLARWFGEEQYGYFSFALSLATFLGMATALGSMTTAIRYLGTYKAGNAWKKMAGLRLFGQRAVLTVSLVVAALGIIASPFLGNAVEVPPLAIVFAFLLVPLFALTDLHAGIGRSFGAIFAALGPRDVLWRGALIVIGAALAFVPALARTPHPITVLLGVAVAVLALLILWQARAVAHRMPPEVMQESAPEFDIPQWRRTALPIWLSSIATVASRSIDVLIVTVLFNPVQAGFYFAASRSAALASFVEQSLNVVVSPQIADDFHAGQTERLRRVVGVAALLSFVSSLAMSLGFVLFGGDLLDLLGPGFRTGRDALVILAVGQTIASASGPAGLLLELSGNEWWSTTILIGASVVGLSIATAGGYFFGLEGVAVGVALSIISANWGRTIAARGRTAIDTSVFSLAFPRGN
ncbi:lipopolysaccharide biosynthesis protein [Qipengyuania sp. YG27]|uniref:Lipopolysaccharide biosynthesis protein n=1 Tax=Qipengyuania mesophila TaxID=2867246 RepID=A0ABS7JQY3_9SPHN|nr:lipopolysaccharide biosynthesis protein [Qipengyuania mesophila]MBX7500026.1 lipopolysaccharide biosynthesis protein [Qipengyuania mesophila]